MPSVRSSPKPDPDPGWAFEALGTSWEITTDRALPNAATERVGAELDRIDRFWSRFRTDSTVAEMARSSGRWSVASSDRPLIDWYRTLYTWTGGAVSPLVGQILDDAGYDADYSLTPADSIASARRWDDVIGWDGDELVIHTPTLLDVGAAGKGFAVDRAAAIIADYVTEFIVDAGGDMVISPRAEPVRIALEHPLDATKAIGVVALAGGALCGSASNRRAWAHWHHIVDPRTAEPVTDVLATWVYAGDAMTADGLATALFFTPAAQLAGVVGADERLRGPRAASAAIGPAAPGLSVGADIAGFRFAADSLVPHHVTIRGAGVEHTMIPGLELYL